VRKWASPIDIGIHAVYDTHSVLRYHAYARSFVNIFCYCFHNERVYSRSSLAGSSVIGRERSRVS